MTRINRFNTTCHKTTPVIVKFKINNDDIIPILLLNGLLIFNMSDPEIETIRMENILDRINRKAYQKSKCRYRKEDGKTS